MNEPDAVRRQIGSQATRAYSQPPRHLRCRLSMPSSTGGPLTAEVACLLRFRLRLAALITAVGGGIYLVRELLQPDTGPHGDVFLLLHSTVVAVTAVLAGVLWSPLPLCVHRLRGIELILFGLLVLFFGWMQFVVWSPGFVIRYNGTDHDYWVMRFVAGAGSLRWFFLLMIYGTFIPNTWQRCLVIVSITAVLPLVLTTAAGFWFGHASEVLITALPDMAVILAMGATIALFGSYRIHALQAEAQEARQIGQYRLKQRLGSGGMGEVYLAEHVLLRRPCALKLIRSEHTNDPTTLTRFEREVQATATLTHWNTVEIYDYGQTEDGTFYYVMEYLPGMSLQELVERDGPLPPERVVHFLRQACAALREAHGTGLIHRDIKPSNILACERGGVRDVVKLLDFGLVQSFGLDREAEKLTVKGAILGSPPFMSPEQAGGKPVDARCDLYSLGAVGYFLLTGQPPFVRDNPLAMLIAHASEPVVPIRTLAPNCPADLEAVLLRCLEKAPEKRFADAAELDRALAGCECAAVWTEDRALTWWEERGQKRTGHDTATASAVTQAV